MAVKEFHPGLSSTSDVQKEAQLLSQLSHPGIQYLFGICTEEEPQLLISSFYGISGKSRSFHDALNNSSLKITLPIWKKVLNDLAKTLIYLHNRGYVHTKCVHFIATFQPTHCIENFLIRQKCFQNIGTTIELSTVSRNGNKTKCTSPAICQSGSYGE